MSKFEIKSQTISTSYEYANESVIVAGTFDKDGMSQEQNVKGIRGDVYLKDESGNRGRMIGNFHGSPDGQGGFLYDLSQMTKEQSDLTWAAIVEIEAEITGKNE